MNILITAQMTNGTIQAKLEPLSRLEEVSNIYFLRKSEGPKIDKVTYIILPKICRKSIFNLTLTPLLLVRYILKLKINYVISYHMIPYAFIAAFATRLTRTPYFVCQTGSEIQRFSEKKMFWFFLKRVLKKARKVCVPGKFSRDHWIKKGIDPDHVQILHSTIDTEKYVPDESITNTYDFIYTGRFAEEKRNDFLVRAFAIVLKSCPDATLALVGDGPKREGIKVLVTELGLNNNITFIEYQNDVLPFLNQAQYVVMTSEMEGLPCSIMEAMSTQLIPVVTNVGNLSDIVIPWKTGYLVDKNDMEGFASSMIELYHLPSETKANLQVQARKIIMEAHSHQSSILKWRNLLLN